MGVRPFPVLHLVQVLRLLSRQKIWYDKVIKRRKRSLMTSGRKDARRAYPNENTIYILQLIKWRKLSNNKLSTYALGSIVTKPFHALSTSSKHLCTGRGFNIVNYALIWPLTATCLLIKEWLASDLMKILHVQSCSMHVLHYFGQTIEWAQLHDVIKVATIFCTLLISITRATNCHIVTEMAREERVSWSVLVLHLCICWSSSSVQVD
jgi:hypothetical protein